MKLVIAQILSFVRRCLRWLLIEWRFQALLGGITLLLFCYIAIRTNNADYFTRSGAIVSLCGLLMTFREYLRGTRDLYWRDGGYADQPAFKWIANPIEAKMKAQRADAKALRTGIWYLVAGTIIWAYGDLLLSAVGFRWA